ncbi:DUF1552 domain-containing protein [uncultured Gimesia sp.]|uniref:DUF1552 domain-containing protein n=1 Tax=uncultured Gimesia sp. TaxID=1678688 RepID=UPI0026031FC0|nr:DUF1552 domain-containing protein [uncultured Gimesia sp.]
MKIISRKAFLVGSGASIALPFFASLEKLYAAKNKLSQKPKRFCSIFFPFGVSLPPKSKDPKNIDYEKYHWFPDGDGGKDYRLSKTLAPLESFKKDITVLSGLSHPYYRVIGSGHRNGGLVLNGANIVKGAPNSISLDQLISSKMEGATRFPSLTLSSGGGVGVPLVAQTISVDRYGKFIPALSEPRRIFNHLFAVNKGGPRALQQKRSVLDRTMESANALILKLNPEDQRAFDDYRQSIRELETDLDRAEEWAGIPRPGVDPAAINLEGFKKQGAQSYLDSMFELIYLALKTDSTRVITYQIACEGTCIGDSFPSLLGLPTHHNLSHGTRSEGGYERWAKYDRFLVQQFQKFLVKLKNTPDEDGSLFDNTINLFGSGTSLTHVHKNYPLILAGGKNLGLKHGQYLKYKTELPMNNLLLSLAHCYGIDRESFGDSSGELSEITKA